MPLPAEFHSTWLTPERECLPPLLDLARRPVQQQQAIHQAATELVNAVRAHPDSRSSMESFLQEYSLASREGVLLMCLAEALLRIPDAGTANRLIADRISAGDWERHLGDSDSLLVNASTWGLMLTGHVVNVDAEGGLRNWLSRLTNSLGEPIVRRAMLQAMRILASQYVIGRDIDEALARAGSTEGRIWRYSFDMLGEAALTQEAASDYFQKYLAAISAVGRQANLSDGLFARPGVSVKLSALHPRFEQAKCERVLSELGPRLLDLVAAARTQQVSLTVDAEEADRLELTLLLVEKVLQSGLLGDYEGFGLAVQAYQRRAPAVIRWLRSRARSTNQRIAVRLVKGAYWDTEIKRAQEQGLSDYPVFTRKAATDVSFLACARLLAQAGDTIFPQFATHNAHTVAYICELYQHDFRAFEFQRLHGMGEALYNSLRQRLGADIACRVYAPVGAHRDLLPYLVRRLLENGANTSFVNRLVDASLPAASVATDPVSTIESTFQTEHSDLVLPPGLFGAVRRNSRGVNLANSVTLASLQSECEKAASDCWQAAAMISGTAVKNPAKNVVSPAFTSRTVGTIRDASVHDVERAVSTAAAAFSAWETVGVAERSAHLLRAADAFEVALPALVARCTFEAGKTLSDATSEVREAVDFLRYYATQALTAFEETHLPGPTGESNVLRLRGRGVFVCISPWNFPLAIFTGQVAAALVAGNTVLAKPAEQTPLTAALAVELLHQSGIPVEVLQFIPGDGASVGAALTRDPRIAGVAFTGSIETARRIERSLASRTAAIATFIAETGGVNAMLVDSSALPEQVVRDVISSGFNSAGQRCSALRVLLLQEEIAPIVLDLLAGAMDELRVGDPSKPETDIGPIIDGEALAALQGYAAPILKTASWHHQTPLPADLPAGHYFAPLAVEVSSLSDVTREVFGPIVHIVRFNSEQLPGIIEQISQSGFGLTLGIHSRIEARARQIAARVRVGNIYINRNMIGAVVESQPFGGHGLSGTGPKAGGPRYLHRFATEQTVTNNTAAIGGNAGLLSSTQE